MIFFIIGDVLLIGLVIGLLIEVREADRLHEEVMRLEEINASYADAVDDWQRKIADLKEELAEASAELQEHGRCCAELEQENQALRSRVNA